MARVIGRLGTVGLAKESVRGTAVAPSVGVPVQSFDFDDKVDYVDNDSSFGRIEELNDSQISKIWGEGGYEGKVFTNTIGLELVALFGQSPTSVQRSTTGVYDHTFALANSNQHQSLTLAYKDANESARWALAMIDTFEISADLDKFVTRKVTYKSKPSTSVANTITMPTVSNLDFLARHIIFSQATNLAGLPGTTVPIVSFTMSIKKNADPNFTFGNDGVNLKSANISDIINQQFTVEGSFDAYRDDLTQRGLVFAGTNKAIRFDILNTDIAGAANGFGTTGSHNPEIRFDLAKAFLTSHERKWDANKPVMQTIQFKATFSLTDTAALVARLTSTDISL